MVDRRKPEPKRSPRRHSRPPKTKPTWAGYTLDPGQKAALEKKFNKSWHQTFTTLSFFDSFRGPKK